MAVAQGASAADFLVNRTDDPSNDDCSPICTLRGAITRANASPGPDRIVFDIGTGVQTISLNSALPAITDTLDIDGTTQPGWIGPPLIVIDGADAGSGADGLKLDAASSTVRSLVIS